MFKRLVPFLFLLALLPSPTNAQQLDIRDLDVVNGRIEDLLAAEDEAAIEDNLANLQDNLHRVLTVGLLGPEIARRTQSNGTISREEVMRHLRFRRSDVQVGASSTSSGSTSAVMNPLLPGILGFSLETGSITRSVSGTTTTIKINPAGLFCASSDDQSKVDAARLRASGCADTARRVAFSLSFDASRSDPDAMLNGLRPLEEQFSEASVRVELINRRTPKSSKFQALLGNWNDRAKTYLSLSQDMNEALRNSQAWRDFKWEAKLADAKKSGGAQANRALKDLLLEMLNAALEESDVRDAMRQTAPNATKSYLSQVEANRNLFNELNHGWVVSAEYALERPAIATEAIGDLVPAGIRPPTLHTARLVAAKGVPTANLDFTINASSSWFGDDRTMEQGRWRDFRFGIEGRFLLGEIPDFGRPVVSFAGLWMHLNQEPLGLGIAAFNEAGINQPGNIGLFQAKLEVPTANAAVRIPISLTFANRTELIKESEVRGQIGITLDLDSFFGN